MNEQQREKFRLWLDSYIPSALNKEFFPLVEPYVLVRYVVREGAGYSHFMCKSVTAGNHRQVNTAISSTFGNPLRMLRELRTLPDYREMSRSLIHLIQEYQWQTVRCQDCGSTSDLSANRIGEIYCDECFEDTFECPQCGELTSRTDFNEDWNRCHSCYEDQIRICNYCEQETSDYDTCAGDYLCPDCFTEHTASCYACGGRFYTDDLEWSEERQQYYCNECEGERIILPYSTNVCHVMCKNSYGIMPKDMILFGVELETIIKTRGMRLTDEYDGEEPTDERYQRVLSRMKDSLGHFCILKHDGSLPSTGVEIVTLPMSIDTHRKEWTPFLDNLPKGLVSWEGERCGVHVHISRRPLGILRIGKMIVFLNDPLNKTLIKTIAGRYGNHFAEAKQKKITDVMSGGERYEMLNLCNQDTVELRIFRGTLNKLHFLADLEFADALVRFCGEASMRSLTQSNFLEYMASHRKDYPNLSKFISSKKLNEVVSNEGER